MFPSTPAESLLYEADVAEAGGLAILLKLTDLVAR